MGLAVLPMRPKKHNLHLPRPGCAAIARRAISKELHKKKAALSFLKAALVLLKSIWPWARTNLEAVLNAYSVSSDFDFAAKEFLLGGLDAGVSESTLGQGILGGNTKTTALDLFPFNLGL